MDGAKRANDVNDYRLSARTYRGPGQYYRWTGDCGQLVHPARRAAGAPVWWCEITRPVVVTPL